MLVEDHFDSVAPTLLVIYPELHEIENTFHLIVAETGEILYSHYCTNGSFAIGDLYLNRPTRQEELKERFSEYEVKFYDEAGISRATLVDRNTQWNMKRKQEQEDGV